MSRFASTLIAIFLGVPGLIMWVGGFVGWVYLSIDLVIMSELTKRELMIAGPLVAAICVFGFVMITSVALMTGARRYRIPREGLPALIGFEILILLAWMISAGALVSTLVAVFFGQLTWNLFAFDLASLGGVFAATHLQRLQRQRQAKALAKVAWF